MWRSTLWINLIDDESSTIYKLRRKKRKEKKNEKWKEYLSLRMQKARSALNVLHEVLCSSQSKQSSFRNSLIISRKFHHFSKVSSLLDATRGLDDASSRWRELSIARASPWSRDEWDIRHMIFISSLLHRFVSWLSAQWSHFVKFLHIFSMWSYS